MREAIGIHAFGINAYTPGEDGTLISEHDEAGSGQEELYIVLDGKATFEVDGETVDAPPGTFVSVGPESRRKATGDGTILAVGAKPGEVFQANDWVKRGLDESRDGLRRKRYADALEAVPVASSRCRTTRASITTTRASQRSRATPATRVRAPPAGRRVAPAIPRGARRDDDFTAVRDDPRFEEALR